MFFVKQQKLSCMPFHVLMPQYNCNNISTHGVIAPHYTDKVVVFDDAGCDAHGDL